MSLTKADNYMKRDIEHILNDGYLDKNPRPHYSDDTPAHTFSVNHVGRSYDLSRGEFPICTLRPIAWKTAIKEIFTIYQKPTNVISEMEQMGVKWWKEWDIGDGTIGQRYGGTVKRYDLINSLIHKIETNPYGRDKIMDLWQEKDLCETKGLNPCAFSTIWNVRGKFLDMIMIQRSGDMLMASGGGGVNEVQYAALLMMIARHTGYKSGVFSHVVANEQIYDRHTEAADELFKRFQQHEKDKSQSLPNLILNPNKKNFYEFTIDDFEMIDYNPIMPQLTLDIGI